MKKRPELQLVVLFVAFTVLLAAALWVFWRQESQRRERILSPDNNPPHQPVAPNVAPPPDEPPAAPSESPEKPATTLPDIERAATLVREAEAAMSAQRYAEAEAQCKEALSILPDYVPALRILAHVYLCQGRADDALPHLAHALRFDPMEPQSLRDLSLAHFMKQNPAAALEVIEASLRVNPEDPTTLAQLGMILLTVPDRYDDAIDALTRAAAAIPANPNIRVNLATAYIRTGRRDDALATLDAVLAERPGYVPALFNRALTFLILDDDLAACIDGLRETFAAADPVQRQSLLVDPDLDPIRRTPEFRALLDEFDPTSSLRIEQGIP